MSQVNRVDIQFAQTGANQVQSGLGGIASGAQRAGRDVEYLRRSLQALGSAFAIKKIFDEVDAYANLQNRLRLVTRDQEELVTIQQKLFDVSQRTRTELELNANLFNRLSTSTVEAKLSYQELLDITETLNQAVQIGGATTNEASAGLIQLSQGLASGALRADELRAVIEQLPGVADIIAKELGTSRAALRTLGAEGKITTEVMIQAFKNARVEVADRFAKSIITPRQALTTLYNSFTNFFGQVSASLGITNGFAGAVKTLTTFIDTLAYGLSGLILILQQDTVLTNALGTAFRLLSVILTVMVAIGVAEFFYGIAKSMIATVAASTPLAISFGLIIGILTALTSFSLGNWLYKNTIDVRNFGDQLAAAVQQAANWFDWLGSVIVLYLKAAFVEVVNLLYTIFITPVLAEILQITDALEYLTKSDYGSAAIRGLQNNINTALTPIDLEGEMEKLGKQEADRALEIGAALNAAMEENAKDFKDGPIRDWRETLGAFLKDFNSTFDQAIAGGGTSMSDWLKKIGKEADDLGLRIKANQDILSRTPNVAGSAAAGLDEYNKKQQKAIDKIEEFTDSLLFEFKVMGFNNAEREEQTNLKKLDELITKALADAEIDLTDALWLYYDAAEAIQLLKDRRDDQELLDKNKELDKSMQDATDDLLMQIDALSDFSRSTETARASLEFAADANKRFGENTTEANDAIKEFDQLLAQTEQLQQFRDLVEDISKTISQSFEEIIFGSKSVGEAIESMVKKVAQTVFNTLVTQQLAGFFTSFLGSFSGAFTGGGGRGFANGGIIDRPQWLGLADGIPAYGGESGPEAVVPLPDGRQIPVMLRGGDGGGYSQSAPTYNVSMTVVTKDADSFRRSKRQVADDLTSQMRRRR